LKLPNCDCGRTIPAGRFQSTPAPACGDCSPSESSAIYGANLLLNRIMPYRVDGDGDWQGMDIRELGAGAYPEFVVHADEFVPR
jgi:hypothetical protein